MKVLERKFFFFLLLLFSDGLASSFEVFIRIFLRISLIFEEDIFFDVKRTFNFFRDFKYS